jgi:hypothetical protein
MQQTVSFYRISGTSTVGCHKYSTMACAETLPNLKIQ